MPLRGQRLSALLSVTFALLIAAPAFGAALDMDSYRWTEEYGSAPFEDGMVLPGRLIVRFAPGAQPMPSAARSDGSIDTGEYALDRVSQEIGVNSIERMYPELGGAFRAMDLPGRDEFFIFQFDPAQNSVLEAAQKLARIEGIVSVEPDEVYRSTIALPNDPGMANQWWLRNTSLGSADIRAVGAWSFTTGSEDVLVCVADSGVDWQHPDLGGTGPDYTDGVIAINQAELDGQPGFDSDGNGFVDDIHGYDFVAFQSTAGTQQNPPQDVVIRDNDPMDYGGHGTAVSGCISAITDNGIGIASTNWNVKILPCRVGWTSDEGDGFIGMSWAAQAMDYARIMGADVFNASWGSGSSLTTAANFLNLAGVVLVESAGNGNNETPSYLGTRDDVISVAATTSSDGKTGFSTYGTWVDISAPGEAIWTTSMTPQPDRSVTHGYTSIQGTSFSSPIVAGAMAMAKSYWPGDTRQQTIDRVLAAVDNIDATTPGYVGKMGSGRLNVTKLFYDGTIWPVPGMMPELIDAMQSADTSDTVAVEGGFVTNGPMLFSAGQEKLIMGGFDATYTSRDPLGNPAIMQLPAGSGTVISISNGVSSDLILDGFLVSGGLNTSPTLAPDEGMYGGGIQIFEASPILRNLIVTGNQAGQTGDNGYGGGIAILSASPTLENVEVYGNAAKSGVGIYAYDSDPVFTNVNVHDNIAWTPPFTEIAVGGGIYMRECPPLGARRVGGVQIDGGNFSGNVSVGAGGGIYALDSDLTITNVTVDNNTSANEGAGIAVSGGSVDLRLSSLTNNTVSSGGTLKHGGGLYTSGAAVLLDSLEVRGNLSTYGGGGLAIEGPTSFSMSNTTLVENTTTIFGAGLYLSAGTTGMTLTGNTVANNSGGSVGGNGVYVSGGDIALQQNIIAFNLGGSSAPSGVHLVGCTATFTCNLLHGNTNGNVGGAPDPIGSDGNIDIDPLFCDMPGGAYTLSVTSPAATAVCGFMGSEETDCGQGTGVTDDTPSTAPNRFHLAQNHPNPFNPTTLIEFSIPLGGPVQLKVFDIRGRLVRSLVNRTYEAGTWSVSWDGRDDGGRSVASGTYLYELRADGERKVRKMGLLK